MKQLTKLIALVGLITVLELFSISDAHGQTTYSFSSIPTTGWSTSGGNQTINNVSWSYSSCNYISVNSSKLQIGSKNNPQTSSWSIQTPISNFGNNVTVLAVSITAYTTAASATYDISVGGKSVEGSLTTSSATYTANNLSATSGYIVVTMTGSSTSKAMYLSNISVTYSSGPVTYTVTYNANDATSGSVPTDATAYTSGATVTVKDNTGYLAKTGNAFSGWNTKADGTGIDRAVGSTFNISANTTLYAKWTPYTIAAQSNNNSYGTVSLMGSVITGAPKSGYRYANPAYTVSSGSATVVQNGDEFTVTPASNCTVTINFEAIPSHIATFSVNGDTTSDSFYEGQTVAFPSNPSAINGKEFVGWIATTISGTTDEAPDFVTSAEMGDNDINFYAVFADVTGSTPASWSETSFGNLTSTDIFVIVGNDGNTFALPSSDASSSPTATSIAIVNGQIDETQESVANNLKWNVSGNSTNGYTFYPNGSTTKYLYCLNDNKGVRIGTPTANTTEDHTFAISDGYLTASFTANNQTTNRYIGVYNSSDWRCYTSNSGTSNIAGQTFAFYKYIAPSATISNYCTTVAAPTQVAIPYFSPAAGAVASGTTVEISCDTEGATIHYTTNGDTPTSSSMVYSEEIEITEGVTIKAIAVKNGLTDSEVASATYTIGTPCSTPVFSVETGAVDAGTKVDIATETEGATIYYTTDGSTPTSNSTEYEGAITINSAINLKAIAVKEGYLASDVASAEYTMVSFASLPLSYDGNGLEALLPAGLTQYGLTGKYDNSPKMKFDSEGDYLILSFNECPGTLTFDIKGNPSSGTAIEGTFKVQVSSNGSSYTDLDSYVNIGNSIQSKTITNIDNSVRYLKWIYASRTGGNVALGNIALTKNTAGSTVTLSAKLNNGRYWTTYYNASTRYTLSDGAQAFIMNSNKQLYLLGDKGRVIPKGTAVVIISDCDTITLTKSDSTDAVDNHGVSNILTGSNEVVKVEDIGGTPYVLGVLYGKIGFYEFDGINIPAMKAYYVVTE